MRLEIPRGADSLAWRSGYLQGERTKYLAQASRGSASARPCALDGHDYRVVYDVTPSLRDQP